MGMPALHIRDISDTLLKELRVGAANSGQTLKDYVVGKLTNGANPEVAGTAARGVHEGRVSTGKARQVSTDLKIEKPDSGKPPKDRDMADHAEPESPSTKLSKHGKDLPSCIHGTVKGYRCWQCGGIAKVK